MRTNAGLIALLIVMGAGWGATSSLAKIAVSEGYRHFGLIFWQTAVGAAVLAPWMALNRRLVRPSLPQAAFATFIALAGTVLPNGASYAAVVHLPAGIMSIVIATVPMLAFPLALALGQDSFSWPRLLGLGLGIVGVALLAQPSSLPEATAIGWIAVAMIGPALYAVEANAVAKLGTFGLDAVAVLFWASAIGAAIALPLALASGSFIPPRWPATWGAPDYALIAGSVIHVLIYAAYVWLVGRAGAVFAGQVAYIVTGCGVLWAMALLGESYAGPVWIALALMLAGLFLVQPRGPSPEVAGVG